MDFHRLVLVPLSDAVGGKIPNVVKRCGGSLHLMESLSLKRRFLNSPTVLRFKLSQIDHIHCQVSDFSGASRVALGQQLITQWLGLSTYLSRQVRNIIILAPNLHEFQKQLHPREF